MLQLHTSYLCSSFSKKMQRRFCHLNLDCHSHLSNSATFLHSHIPIAQNFKLAKMIKNEQYQNMVCLAEWLQILTLFLCCNAKEILTLEFGWSFPNSKNTLTCVRKLQILRICSSTIFISNCSELSNCKMFKKNKQ